MAKSNRKTKKYDPIKALIIKKLAAKHKVDPAFVRMAISGDRDSETATEIKKQFGIQYQNMIALTQSI